MTSDRLLWWTIVVAICSGGIGAAAVLAILGVPLPFPRRYPKLPPATERQIQRAARANRLEVNFGPPRRPGEPDRRAP